MPPKPFDPPPGDGDYPLRVGYTCELTKDWKELETKYLLKKGMAGTVFKFNEWSVVVGLQGLKKKCTVPRNIVRGGPALHNTWSVQGHDMDLKVAPRNSKDLDTHEQFPKAVKALLSALQDGKFPTLRCDLRKAGDKGSNIDGITKRITAGVRDAGLLDVLNTPTFTVHDIQRNASLLIGANTESHRSGVYLRIYTTTVGNDSDIQTYVGKAKDFETRFSVLLKPSSKQREPKHWKLHHSKNVTAVWVALCILDNMPDSLLHLTEQVFVCLLETYKKSVSSWGATAADELHLSGLVDNAIYMIKTAHEAQKASNWPGAAISRPQQYGAAKGMNIQSPLTEFNMDRTQLIRTEVWFPMSDTMEMAKIVNFRRAIPRRAIWFAKSKNTLFIPWISIYWTDSDAKEKKWAICSSESEEVIAKGVDVPGQDTPYATVFEVRLDGKPHPRSFMRGPKIPVFVNSGIADSWALRIEWNDPSGAFRSRYVQTTGFRSNYNLQGVANGQTEHYLRCISLIHYLFNAPYQDLRSGYFNMGSANVLQAHHDHFRQKISFGPQTPYPVTIDYSRISAAEQIQMMINSGLQKVNIPWNQRPINKRSRPPKPHYCDSCVLESEKNLAQHMYCEQQLDVQTNVCTHCYKEFGRAACSFTPNIRADKREDEGFKARFRPLLHMPPLQSDAMDTVDPELQPIPVIEGDDKGDEVSDGELDI